MTDAAKLPSGNCPSVERQINGTRYTVTRLGWWGMLDALHRLEELIGPAFTELLKTEAAHAGASLLDVDTGILGPAICGLLHRVTDRRGMELLEMLGRQTSIETEGRHVALTQAAIDTWFSQHPADAIPWLLFCAEVQFRDFFERPMKEIGGRVFQAAGAAPASQSPTT